MPGDHQVEQDPQGNDCELLFHQLQHVLLSNCIEPVNKMQTYGG